MNHTSLKKDMVCKVAAVWDVFCLYMHALTYAGLI